MNSKLSLTSGIGGCGITGVLWKEGNIKVYPEIEITSITTVTVELIRNLNLLQIAMYIWWRAF